MAGGGNNGFRQGCVMVPVVDCEGRTKIWKASKSKTGATSRHSGSTS